MTRRLAPEFLDTIDMSLVVCEELGMVDPEMMKVWHTQDTGTFPTVQIDDAVGNHFSLDDRQRSRWIAAGGYLRVDLASTLKKTEPRDFSATP